MPSGLPREQSRSGTIEHRKSRFANHSSIARSWHGPDSGLGGSHDHTAHDRATDGADPGAGAAGATSKYDSFVSSQAPSAEGVVAAPREGESSSGAKAARIVSSPLNARSSVGKPLKTTGAASVLASSTTGAFPGHVPACSVWEGMLLSCVCPRQPSYRLIAARLRILQTRAPRWRLQMAR